MFIAVDVHYHNSKAQAAGVLYRNWTDCEAEKTLIVPVEPAASYIPGQFYKRELPCIMAVLERLDFLPQCIIIDGYVYLGRERAPGLGKYLFDAIEKKSSVIGVAKNPFKDPPSDTQVFRGKSKRPIYVSSAGMGMEEAKYHIGEMCGKHRIPRLIKMADSLSKQEPPAFL